MDKTYALNLQELSDIAYARARAEAGEGEARMSWGEMRGWRESAVLEQDFARLLWRRQAAVRGLLDYTLTEDELAAAKRGQYHIY